MRQTFSIWFYWSNLLKLPPKYSASRSVTTGKIEPFIADWKHKKIKGIHLLYLRFYSVFSLFLIVFRGRSEWERKYFWQDSFITPFYRNIGCRLFGHRWEHLSDDSVFCMHCSKQKKVDYKDWDRAMKLKKIKKKIKW